MAKEPVLVHVALGPRSYNIVIGAGYLSDVRRFLQPLGRITHVAMIADEQVVERYACPLRQVLAEAGIRVDLFSVPSGEKSKSVAEAERLWNALLEANTGRDSYIFAVGGGVVGDLAGFVAATFARGLPFVQVPTTLLAQVDSSVGGKVGINLPAAKNMVGAFWQPRLVLIDVHTLDSLPQRQYQAGLAEVVKYGMILDASFFDYLEQHAQELLARQAEPLMYIVRRSCQLKAAVVGEDERETTGRRAILNYGHTFGHALESVTAYETLLHGEAVAIGMHYAARLAVALGRITPDVADRQDRLLEALGLPIRSPPCDVEQLLAAMQHDKKVAHGQWRFVLPRRIGHVELVSDVPEEVVRRILAE